MCCLLVYDDAGWVSAESNQYEGRSFAISDIRSLQLNIDTKQQFWLEKKPAVAAVFASFTVKPLTVVLDRLHSPHSLIMMSRKSLNSFIIKFLTFLMYNVSLKKIEYQAFEKKKKRGV